jgi:hypothetical protein
VHTRTGTRWNTHSYLRLTMRWLQREIFGTAVVVLACTEECAVAALLALIDGAPVHLHPTGLPPRGGVACARSWGEGGGEAEPAEACA